MARTMSDEAPAGEAWNTVELPVNRRGVEAAIAHELVKSGHGYDPGLARRIADEVFTVLAIDA